MAWPSSNQPKLFPSLKTSLNLCLVWRIYVFSEPGNPIFLLKSTSSSFVASTNFWEPLSGKRVQPRYGTWPGQSLWILWIHVCQFMFHSVLSCKPGCQRMLQFSPVHPWFCKTKTLFGPWNFSTEDKTMIFVTEHLSEPLKSPPVSPVPAAETIYRSRLC